MQITNKPNKLILDVICAETDKVVFQRELHLVEIGQIEDHHAIILIYEIDGKRHYKLASISSIEINGDTVYIKNTRRK